MATERRLIGLYSPLPQSGKTSAAGFLQDDLGYALRSFATPLKRMVADLMGSAGYTPEETGYFMDAGKEEPIPRLGGRSFRYLCQTIGTEWGRNLIASELWVDTLSHSVTGSALYVVDDVRFPNEAQAIKDMGGELWLITNPRVTGKMGHSSEGLLDDWPFDRVIVNAGDLDTLRAAINAAIAD